MMGSHFPLNKQHQVAQKVVLEQHAYINCIVVMHPSMNEHSNQEFYAENGCGFAITASAQYYYKTRVYSKNT